LRSRLIKKTFYDYLLSEGIRIVSADIYKYFTAIPLFRFLFKLFLFTCHQYLRYSTCRLWHISLLWRHDSIWLRWVLRSLNNSNFNWDVTIDNTLYMLEKSGHNFHVKGSFIHWFFCRRMPTTQREPRAKHSVLSRDVIWAQISPFN